MRRSDKWLVIWKNGLAWRLEYTTYTKVTSCQACLNTVLYQMLLLYHLSTYVAAVVRRPAAF